LYGAYREPNTGDIWDSDHAGYWGATIEQIINGGLPKDRTGNLNIWVETYLPDIVPIHLGTNDAARDNQSVESNMAELEEVIQIIRQHNPKAVILLAQLIPTQTADQIVRIEEFNAAIPVLAQKLHTELSPVVVVDHYTGFLREYLNDNWHTNEEGAQFMAETWYEKLKPYIKKGCGDIKFAEYDSSVVINDPSACITSIPPFNRGNKLRGFVPHVIIGKKNLRIYLNGTGSYRVIISDLQGKVIQEQTGKSGQELFLTLGSSANIYLLRILKGKQSYLRKIILMQP
jgi:lysophospholipase L1-like esterase